MKYTVYVEDLVIEGPIEGIEAKDKDEAEDKARAMLIKLLDSQRHKGIYVGINTSRTHGPHFVAAQNEAEDFFIDAGIAAREALKAKARGEQ
tara:strand:- start:4764 stop:5039 length:276 start_codon:yes stop_codon:yes gene_type:complete